MPGFLLTSMDQMFCPHGGQITAVPSFPKTVAGPAKGSILTTADQFVVKGCTFQVSAAPHPCLLVHWANPALHVKLGGIPALLATSVGTCFSGDQSPQGVAIVAPAQADAVGV